MAVGLLLCFSLGLVLGSKHGDSSLLGQLRESRNTNGPGGDAAAPAEFSAADEFFRITVDPVSRAKISERITDAGVLAVYRDILGRDSLLILGGGNPGLMAAIPRPSIVRRFSPGSTDHRQVLVIPSSQGLDLLDLLGLITSQIKHGSWDNRTELFDDLISIMRRRSLSLSCSNSSLFVKELLGQLGIRSRIVTTLTKAELNGYDDGHTLLEVFDNVRGKWVLVDVDGDAYFTATGRREPYSLLELAALHPSAREAVQYVMDPFLDYSGAGGFQMSAEHAVANRRWWYQRVMGYFGIRKTTDGTHSYWFLVPDGAVGGVDRVKRYSDDFRALGEHAFVREFYP